MNVDHWANVTQFRQSAGLGIACTVANLDNLLQSSPSKNVNGSISLKNGSSNSSSSQSDRHKIIIQSLSSSIVVQDCADESSVVVGTEKWMAENGISIENSIAETIANERKCGNISILCALNGKLSSTVKLYLLSFDICFQYIS